MQMQQDLEDNPFRPLSSEQLSDPSRGVRVDFVPILRRWERFRLLYNGGLVTYCLLWSCFLLPHLLFDPLYIFQLCVGGLVTNLCFFVGPAIEGYGRYFGVWNMTFSVLLFFGGIFFTGLLATLFLIARGF